MNSPKKGDIIWAKLRGYPWWPAHFVKIWRHKPEPLIEVMFINDNSRAFVLASQIVSYLDKREKYSKTKRKDLLKSICCADLLISEGNTTRLKEKDNPLLDTKEESRKLVGKRKLIISDSDDELSLKDTEISSIEDARNLLMQLIKKEDFDLANSKSNKLQTVIKIIKNEPSYIRKEDVEKFIGMYGSIDSLKEVMDEAKKVLKSINKKVELESSFEQSTDYKTPHRLKHLKHFDSEEDKDELEVSSNSVNEPNKEAAYMELNDVEPKNFQLAATICQEISKLIEDVFLVTQ